MPINADDTQQQRFVICMSSPSSYSQQENQTLSMSVGSQSWHNAPSIPVMLTWLVFSDPARQPGRGGPQKSLDPPGLYIIPMIYADPPPYYGVLIPH